METPAPFRKEYSLRSRTIEVLFLIMFIVLLIPISPLLLVWVIGKIIEPVHYDMTRSEIDLHRNLHLRFNE
ncbi:DUF4014 family protein [Escherichia coli]|nr:DUF4014 family protein [Escherichia coli]